MEDCNLCTLGRDLKFSVIIAQGQAINGEKATLNGRGLYSRRRKEDREERIE